MPTLPDDATRRRLESATSSIERSPNVVDGYLARSAISFELEDYSAAVEDLSEALRIDPRCAIALINRANAYGIMRCCEQALADLNATLSLELPPNDKAQAYYLRGRTYCQMDRLDESDRDLDEALSRVPNHVAALQWRSKLRFRKEQYDLCIADCTMLIDSCSGNVAAAFCRRGQSYAQIGRRDNALADLNRAIHMSPSMVRAFIARAYVHQHDGRYHDAISDFSAAVALRPGDVIGLNSRADCHRAFGRLDLAIDDCDAALKLDPNNVTTLTIRADTLAALGRKKEALADWDRAIELGHNDPAVLAAWRDQRTSIRDTV